MKLRKFPLFSLRERYVLDAITGRIYSYYFIETWKFSSLLEESDKVYGFFVKSYIMDGL